MSKKFFSFLLLFLGGGSLFGAIEAAKSLTHSAAVKQSKKKSKRRQRRDRHSLNKRGNKRRSAKSRKKGPRLSQKGKRFAKPDSANAPIMPIVTKENGALESLKGWFGSNQSFQQWSKEIKESLPDDATLTKTIKERIVLWEGCFNRTGLENNQNQSEKDKAKIITESVDRIDMSKIQTIARFDIIFGDDKNIVNKHNKIKRLKSLYGSLRDKGYIALSGQHLAAGQSSLGNHHIPDSSQISSDDWEKAFSTLVNHYSHAIDSAMPDRWLPDVATWMGLSKSEGQWEQALEALDAAHPVVRGMKERQKILKEWKDQIGENIEDAKSDLNRIARFLVLFGDIGKKGDEYERLKCFQTLMVKAGCITPPRKLSSYTNDDNAPQAWQEGFLKMARVYADDVQNVFLAACQAQKTTLLSPMNALGRHQEPTTLNWQNESLDYWKKEFEPWFFLGFDRDREDSTNQEKTILQVASGPTFIRAKNNKVHDYNNQVERQKILAQAREWTNEQYRENNNGRGNNCGAMSLFAKKTTLEQIALAIVNDQALTDFYLSHSVDDLEQKYFIKKCQEVQKDWDAYLEKRKKNHQSDTESIGSSLSISLERMKDVCERAAEWAKEQTQATKKPLLQWFKEYAEHASPQAANADVSRKAPDLAPVKRTPDQIMRDLRHAFVLVPDSKIQSQNGNADNLRGGDGQWAMAQVDTETKDCISGFLLTMARLAKANILAHVIENQKENWILVPCLDSDTMDTIVWYRNGMHFQHYEPKDSRNDVQKAENAFQLGQAQSPHALYQLKDIPFAKDVIAHVLNNIRHAQSDDMQRVQRNQGADHADALKKQYQENNKTNPIIQRMKTILAELESNDP